MSGPRHPHVDSLEIASQRSPDGLLDITAYSRALRRRADPTLFAPAGARLTDELPLVVLLHGVYGSHWAWARNGQAHHTVQAMVDAGHIRPLLLAMPSDGLVGIGSGYAARQDADAESWIAEEVPTLARAVYPDAGAPGAAIAGLSMGGWGALRLAARRPGLYRAAAAMSPLTRWEHVAGYAPLDRRSDYADPVEDPDLAELLLARRTRLPPLRLTCGRDDALLPDVRRLRDQLAHAHVEVDYEEAAGGHEWPVWERELRRSLVFIDSCW